MVTVARTTVDRKNSPAAIQLGHQLRPTHALKTAPANANSVSERKRREGVKRARYLLTTTDYHSESRGGMGRMARPQSVAKARDLG
jgi:hypothetical protein